MALVDNGLKVSLSAGQIPAGAAEQIVTEFTDHEYVNDVTITVPKDRVHTTNKATTFNNILNDSSHGIKAQVTALLTADYIATNTVTYYSEITYITSNYASNNPSGDFYTDADVSYICTVRIFVKTV